MEVCQDKVECKVSAKRMWHAAFEDGHNCLPKAVPHAVSHISYDGYAEEMSKEKHLEHVIAHVKEELEEVDNIAFKLKGKFVEGGFLGILLKQYKQTVHIEEGPNADTCAVHWSIEYEALSEEHKPRAISTFKDLVPLGYKALESYLLSHDDYKEV